MLRLRKGSAQYRPAQFQSGDQYGSDWHWGSHYYDDESTGEKTLGEAEQNNKYSDIPRNLLSGRVVYGGLYNWYTSTAGSGTFDSVVSDGPASDSLCPYGWLAVAPLLSRRRKDL